MSKYQTEAGIECTPEEDKLIDSLKRLAKSGKRTVNAFGCIQPIILHRNLRNMEAATLKIV